jgi:hypothetical protein
MFTDQELADVLQVRQPFQKQDPVDEPVRMFHLVNRLFIFAFFELVEPPVLVHARMEKILVYRGQFVLKDLIEIVDDLGVRLHVNSSLYD